MIDSITEIAALVFAICSLISLHSIFINVKQDLDNCKAGNAAMSFISGVVITGSYAAFAYIFWQV